MYLVSREKSEINYDLARGVVNMFLFELKTNEMNNSLGQLSSFRNQCRLLFEKSWIWAELNEANEDKAEVFESTKLKELKETYEEKLEYEFYPFFEEMDDSYDQNVVFDVLQTHGRFEDTLEYAKLIVKNIRHSK